MPRKGAFARCVESVESRGGVSDPRAVCASSIARKRGRTRGRVNPQTVAQRHEKEIRRYIDGAFASGKSAEHIAKHVWRKWGYLTGSSGDSVQVKMSSGTETFTSNPEKRNLFGFGGSGPVTYSPTANKKAFSAGKSSGDTGLFDKWYKKSGYEKKGYDKSPLEREYERGVNAGIDEISERRAKKAAATVAKAARYVEAGNPKPSKAEKTLLETAGRLALLGGGGVPAVLLAGNPSLDLVRAADGAGQQSGREWPSGKKPSTTAMDREFKDWLAYRAGSIPGLSSLSAYDKGQLRGAFFRGVRQGYKGNSGRRRRNPGTDSADEAYREFHGRDADEIVTFTSQHHYPKHTAAIGDLIELTIRAPKERGLQDRYITLSDFGEAWLTRHPRMKQLYTEGGDQSVDLGQFGLDSRDPHETEYLGELVRCVYFTRKDHLGKDGGIANYHHKFGKNELTLDKTELIKVGYHVPDEQLLFVGGGYEIPAEGIDG